MSAYIPAPWILWDMLDMSYMSYGKAMGKPFKGHQKAVLPCSTI